MSKYIELPGEFETPTQMLDAIKAHRARVAAREAAKKQACAEPKQPRVLAPSRREMTKVSKR